MIADGTSGFVTGVQWERSRNIEVEDALVIQAPPAIPASPASE